MFWAPVPVLSEPSSLEDDPGSTASRLGWSWIPGAGFLLQPLGSPASPDRLAGLLE
jgi:hypothetical protein